MPQDEKSLISLSVNPLKWSDNSLFNGFILLGLGLPTSAIPVVQVGYAVDNLFVRSPVFHWHRIKDGVFKTPFYVIRNDKITPPGTRWYAYFYDLSNRIVAPTMGSATALNINAANFTITPPTLTVPTTSATSPSFFGYGDMQ